MIVTSRFNSTDDGDYKSAPVTMLVIATHSGYGATMMMMMMVMMLVVVVVVRRRIASSMIVALLIVMVLMALKMVMRHVKAFNRLC